MYCVIQYVLIPFQCNLQLYNSKNSTRPIGHHTLQYPYSLGPARVLFNRTCHYNHPLFPVILVVNDRWSKTRVDFNVKCYIDTKHKSKNGKWSWNSVVVKHSFHRSLEMFWKDVEKRSVLHYAVMLLLTICIVCWCGFVMLCCEKVSLDVTLPWISYFFCFHTNLLENEKTAYISRET